MPRGQHANSLANLAGATGGDRYAGKRAIIAAIEEALRTADNHREVREFFGLRPGRLLKQKHKDRWARVKAEAVYREMVRAMSGAIVRNPHFEGSIDDAVAEFEADLRFRYAGYVADGDMTQAEADEEIADEVQGYRQYLESVAGERVYGVLAVEDFVRMRARKAGELYPVGQGGPVAESQLDYVKCELLGFSDNFGQLQQTVARADCAALVWKLDYVANGPTRPVMHLLAAVRQKSTFRVGLAFEGSGQTEQRDIPTIADRVWGYLVLPDNEYWNANPPAIVQVQRYIENEADFWATVAGLGGSGTVFEYQRSLAMNVEEWNEVRASEKNPSGWEFEFPVLGAGKGGTVPFIASLFPRRQRVWGQIDPVNANVVYDDVEWVDWDTWNARYGVNRGNWLMQGKIVPPEEKPPEKRALEVTFDEAFIEGIQPEAPGDAAP